MQQLAMATSTRKQISTGAFLQSFAWLEGGHAPDVVVPKSGGLGGAWAPAIRMTIFPAGPVGLSVGLPIPQYPPRIPHVLGVGVVGYVEYGGVG